MCVCLIITHEHPLTDSHLILIGELGRTTGMFLAWFTIFVSEFTVIGVNPGKAWIPGDCSIIDTFLNGHKLFACYLNIK